MERYEFRPKIDKNQGLYEGDPEQLKELSLLGTNKLVLLLTGPNGVGKGTVAQYLEYDKKLMISKPVSYTTRPIGTEEQEGIDYHFISSRNFEKMVEGNQFLQWSKLGGNYYGISIENCRRLFEEEKNIILETGRTSTLRMREFLSNVSINCIDICLLPSNIRKLEIESGIDEAVSILKTRMTERNRGESEDVIFSRLAIAKSWLSDVGSYSWVVANEQGRLDQTISTITEIIREKLSLKDS